MVALLEGLNVRSLRGCWRLAGWFFVTLAGLLVLEGVYFLRVEVQPPRA